MRVDKLTEGAVNRLDAARRSRDRAAERVAARIIADVQRRGDRALADWAARLDGMKLSPRRLWVSAAELEACRRRAPKTLVAAIRQAAGNIRRVAERELPRPWTVSVARGVRIGHFYQPLDRVGCYVPGGRFPLISTLLMTVVPAQVAGVAEILVACPRPSPDLLAAAHLLGVRRVLRLGGAQAVAALAYGTKSVPRVDKICGPGNRFVTAAKRLVSADCGIDLPAGPTELLVLAERASPAFIAADLLAQAEHDPDAVSLFVTPSARLAKQVLAELEKQLATLPPGSPARQSLDRSGPIFLARNRAEAIEFSNRFAAEHLSLPDGEALLSKIRAAGSIFVGPWSAQPAGDYATGSNHVLPTAGWARARGGLSVTDFLRPISVQRLSRAGLAGLAQSIVTLARSEGLEAHARAVEVRG
ncbi:MAG TPA: histidinol dehydrogenase [Candidatus Dormibacteraeota bacterium]|nr:histidinol dehydrogenase [Candidatus Dormibacteraeota bacterium]